MQENQQREAARAAFDDAGREITQAFDTLSGNLTLAGGTLAALLAVIGAGELFSRPTMVVSVNGSATHLQVPAAPLVHGLPKFSNASLLLLAVALPLVVRFFVRATFGYQQLLRYNRVRNAEWRFLSGQQPWAHARSNYDVYVIKWRSPASRGTLFWGSAKYGFVWVFVLYATVLGWAFYTASGSTAPFVAAGAILVGIGFEFVTLGRSKLLDVATDEQIAETAPAASPVLEAGRTPPIGDKGTGADRSYETELFVGLRRLGRRKSNAAG